ncbi:hypothetical protein LCGC14_1710070 [marine sediment metagenome]|uniref:Uncharacterized protein n=1 Tax=marine sediment metagenome TaxID=412755 RepID=A0A0F9JVZ8_9ZZZZ
MYLYRSFSAWLVYLGVMFEIIGISSGPLMGGSFYIPVGLLMLMFGSLGMYLKYRKKSKCPSCREHLRRNVKYVCPHCNNTLK